MIITYNEEGYISVNGQPFEVVPVWKWMQENELWQALPVSRFCLLP